MKWTEFVLSLWSGWVLTVSWQTALLTALVAIAALAARRLSARVRYALWLLVIVKIFLPPSLAPVWGVGNWGLQPLWRHARASVPGIDNLAARPWLEGRAAQQTPNSMRPVDPVPIAAVPPRVGSQQGATSHPWTPSKIFFALWLIGGASFAGFVGWRYRRLLGLLRRAEEVAEGPLRIELERLALEAGIERAPALLLSDNVVSPFLFGLRRPRIVLPSGLPASLAPEELRHVLLHELTHWKRRDLVVGWLQVLTQALFWFHPFVWLANERIRHERERACDEAVLAFGQCEPKGYGKSLLKVLLAAEGRSSVSLGFLGIFERNTRLQIRLEGIMSYTGHNRRLTLSSLAFVVCFAAVFLPMSGAQTAPMGGQPRTVAAPAQPAPSPAGAAERDASLTEVQRAYMEWTEKTFAAQLDGAKYAGLTGPMKAKLETEAIANLTGNKDRATRCDAINCLAVIGSKQALWPLFQVAAETIEKDNRERWMAVRALGMLGDKSAVPVLIHLLYHYNQNTRFWAQISLARLTGANYEADWQAWGQWWTSQKGQPPFVAKQVVWTATHPELADPEAQKHADAQMASQLLGGGQQQPTGGAPRVLATNPRGGPPRILATVPVVGAKEVDPALTAITVTFDQDMDAGFSWTGGGPDYPKTTDKPRWIDKRTCALPVQLEAGKYYRVGINSTSFQNFRSAMGVPTQTSAIYFTTKGANPELLARTAKPQIVEMNPANGASGVDPNLKELRIAFNTPMGGGFSWTGGGPNFPTIPQGQRPSWSADRKTCILPVQLQPNWEYRLGLNSPSHKNFQSEGGVPLDPVIYTFRTRQ